MQLCPLQPGAGAPKHSHAPFLQVAWPAGSLPQHLLESEPKQLGAEPEHAAVLPPVPPVPAFPALLCPPVPAVPAVPAVPWRKHD